MDAIITTTGEIYTYNHSKLRYVCELDRKGYHAFEGQAECSMGKIPVTIVSRDDKGKDPVAIITFCSNRGSFGTEWVLASDPNTIIYKIEVISPTNETSCAVSINPRRSCQLPLIVDELPDCPYSYFVGQTFTTQTTTGYRFMVVGASFLKYTRSERLPLLANNWLSEKVMNKVVEEKCPDIIPAIRGYIARHTL